MHRLRKLFRLFGLTCVAATSLTIVYGQSPETDAAQLESAVDRLGFLPPQSDAIVRRGQRVSPRKSTSATASTGRATSRDANRPADTAGRRTPAGTSSSRYRAKTQRPQQPARKPGVGKGPILFDPSTSLDEEEETLLEEDASLETPETSAADLAQVVVEPGTEISSELQRLRSRVRKTLSLYYPKQLNTRDHNPWELMHGIVAYGVDAKIRRNGPDGRPVNAIAYLSINGRMNGMQLLYLDRGRINAQKGVKVQGHYGQLLAILAQSRVKSDYPLRVDGKEFTVADLIETEQRTCRTGIELTFKLISFAHYLDSDETWTSETGETWDIPSLIADELKQPILSNAACGGTHRLMGFAYAISNRKKQGRPIDGQWLRAEKYLDDYHQYTFALQNSDGSFSTEWFRRREAKDDINRRIQTTGHILEWMVYSLPEQQLDDPRLLKAVNYLTGILLREPNREWEIGPLGHAIHSLAIYDHRRFKPLDEVPIGVARNARPSQSNVAPAESSVVK